VIEKGEDTRDL